MESYKHDFDTYKQQLDDAEQQGYIDGYNDCHKQYPIKVFTILIIGLVIGYLLGVNLPQ